MKTMKMKMNKILFLIFVAISFTACSKNEKSDNSIDNIKYKISYSPEEVIQNSTVIFDPGKTANPTYTYEWDFGDGKSSTEMKPTHIYTEVGDYVVVLKVTNEKEESIKKAAKVEVFAIDTGDVDGKLGLRSAMDRMGDHIWLCAHRGQSFENDEPENSLASLEKMISQGVEMSEIDIRQTKDGELIISHDATIDRMTNGSGKISDLTLSEIQSYNLMVDGHMTSQVMPKLSDVLELVKGKMYLDLDIKINNYNKVYQVVKQYGMLSQVAYSIYDLAKAKELIALDDQLVLMPIIHDENEYNSYTNANLNLALMQFNSSMYTGSVGSSFIDKAKSEGISFFGNCYMNDPRTPDGTNFNQVDRFIGLKGQIIQTDYSITIKSYLENKGLN